MQRHPWIIASLVFGCGGSPQSPATSSEETEAGTGTPSSTTDGQPGTSGTSPSGPSTESTSSTGSPSSDSSGSGEPTQSGTFGTDASSSGEGEDCGACPEDGTLATACIDNRCVATACGDGYLMCGSACCEIQYQAEGPGRITAQLDDGTLVGIDPNGADPCRWFTFDGSNWTEHEQVPPFFDEEGRESHSCDVALSPDGEVHLIYEDDQPNFVHRIMEARAGNGWTPQEVQVFDAGVGFNGLWTHSLSVRDQRMLLVTRTSTGDDTAWIREGGSWTAYPGFQAENARTFEPFTVVLDTQGRPHVAFYSPGGCLNYRRPFATDTLDAFDAETVDCTEPDEFFFSFALDPDDRPHLVYYSNQTYELRHAQLVDDEWVRDALASSDTRQPGSQGTSLAFDAYGHPHIVYENQGDAPSIYLQFDGTQWHERSFEDTLRRGDVFIDRDNNVHLARWDSHWHP